MKEVLALIQLTLAALKFANWIAGKIDKVTWEASGYNKAVAEQTAVLQRTIGVIREIKDEVERKTESEVIEELAKNKELRD